LDPSKPDKWFPFRVAVLIGVPLVLVIAANAIDSSTWSPALNDAAIVALGVMLIESLVEVRRQSRTHDEALELLQNAHERAVAHLEERVARQASELEQAPDDRSLATLLTYVGETAPTVAEMAVRDPHILDGWFDLISTRIQRATGTGYAGLLLLREEVDWVKGDFIGSYEVACGGGSSEFGLNPGDRLVALDTVQAVLLREARVGSVYFSEFSFNDRPYWLCALLSTSSEHRYLDTLMRAMVAPVLVALDALPPSMQEPRVNDEPSQPRGSTP
jgi:hypothetical protein